MDLFGNTKIMKYKVKIKPIWGVPISFLDKWNPAQFEIVGIDRELTFLKEGKTSRFFLNKKEVYARILIKKLNKK